MRTEHATVRSQRFPTLRVRGAVRNLAIVLGDQLDPHAAALTGLDASTDAVLMMEVAGESTHVPSHKQRTTLFLAAMRHFAIELQRRGFRVQYVPLDDPANTHSARRENAQARGAPLHTAGRVARPAGGGRRRGRHRASVAYVAGSALPRERYGVRRLDG